MITTQLMLGDWIHLKPLCEGRPDSNCQVCGIGKDTIFYRSGSHTLQADDKLVEFIPLTKRILRKNGFEPYENVPNVYERVDADEERGIFFRLEVRLDRRIIYIFASFLNKNGRSIQRNAKIEGCGMYVHNLQQALRLAGLTAMANNFKV